MTLYLADSSIWSGRRRTEAGDLSRRFVDRLRRSEIATCVPVALEVLTGPADGEAYVRDWTRLWGQLHWLPLRERATGRALEVQSELALAVHDERIDLLEGIRVEELRDPLAGRQFAALVLGFDPGFTAAEAGLLAKLRQLFDAVFGGHRSSCARRVCERKRRPARRPAGASSAAVMLSRRTGVA